MEDILNSIKIVDVYTCLTGCIPRKSGKCYRGKATWRNGGGLNVSFDNDRGVWHDFATDDGGGILDLIVRIQGGTRRDALIWASDFVGIPLETKEFTPEERTEWVEAKKTLERDLPEARYWQRAAINITENVLTNLKAQLFDPTSPDPEGIYDLEQMLARLQSLDGHRLVEDYHWWLQNSPAMTGAMTRAVKQLETIERAVLNRYLRHERSRH